jgi:hypothetical protein
MKEIRKFIDLAKKAKRIIWRQQHSFRLEKIAGKIMNRRAEGKTRYTEAEQEIINDIIRRAR